jgi:hypothetical protein
MNHGGFDEYDLSTGYENFTIDFDTKCGGGIQFSLMDEWFKRTWVSRWIIPESRVHGKT